MRESKFLAMGSTAHVLVVGGPDGLLERAAARIEELESRWSRFRPDSEVSRLNAAPAGEPVPVSPDTLVLVDLACQGYAVSRGAFDPSMLANVIGAGYGSSLVDDLESGEPLVREVAGTAPVLHGDLTEEFVVDADAGTVTRNSDLQFDPGGLGKGLAADLVADDLMAAGAGGVLINLGGDLRATGTGPDGNSWHVEVEDPRDGSILCVVSLDDGAMATSSRMRRRWTDADGNEGHHLLDPSTGRPAATTTNGATVIARFGWQAEVLAKAAFLDEVSSDDVFSLIEELGAAALVVTEGIVLPTARWADFVVTDPS
jgi:thiamine biosynthesis lipoprotein